MRLRRISNDGIVNLFYVFFYTLELLIAIYIVACDPNYRLYNGLILSDALDSFGIASLVACLSVYCGQSVSNSLFGNYGISISNRLDILDNQYNINKLSIWILFGFLFTILSSFDVSYAIAVIALSFSFSPLFIGLVWQRIDKISRILWVIALAANTLFHSLQGSRGTAFFPIVFVIVGYLVSIVQQKKLFRRKLIVFSIIALLSTPVLSFVALFRSVSGRGIEVNIDNISLLWDFMQSYSSHSSQNESEQLGQSFGRMLIEANVAAIKQTPDNVPYRDFESITDELVSIISLKGEQGSEEYRQSRGSAGFGTGVATRYGFNVNKTTSVEWPLFADGYSRFGYIGLILYSFLFALFLSFIEKKVAKQYQKHALLSLILILFIAYNGVLSYMYSYYSFFKLLIFRMSLVIFSTQIMGYFCKRQKQIIR